MSAESATPSGLPMGQRPIFIDPPSNCMCTTDPATGSPIWIVDPTTGLPLTARPVYADPASGLLCAADPVTGKIAWIIDPVTKRPMVGPQGQAPQPAAAPEPEPEPVVAAEPEPEPVVAAGPEPVVAPEPEVAAAPALEPEPAVAPAAVTEPEPVAAIAPEPAAVAVPEPEPAIAPEPAAVAEPELVIAPEPEPVVAPEPEPEIQPTLQPEPVAVPEPAVSLEPEPVVPEPQPEPAMGLESILATVPQVEPAPVLEDQLESAVAPELQLQEQPVVASVPAAVSAIEPELAPEPEPAPEAQSPVMTIPEISLEPQPQVQSPEQEQSALGAIETPAPQGEAEMPAPAVTAGQPAGAPMPTTDPAAEPVVVSDKPSMSGAAITSMVLGIVAIGISFIPIVNNVSFFLALLGLVLALVGTSGIQKGKKRGKGFAIAGVLLCVISVVVVLATQYLFASAFDSLQKKIESGTEPVAASVSGTSASASSVDYASMKVGDSVTLDNGMVVTVNSVKFGLKNFDGTDVAEVNVTYQNKGKENLSFNVYDWKALDSSGALRSETYYSNADKELQSGDLMPGGSVTGSVYFEGEPTKVYYYDNVIQSESNIGWVLK